jgi:hypothetical protein
LIEEINELEGKKECTRYRNLQKGKNNHLKININKGLVAGCHSFFLFILIFYNIHTFIQSQYIHPSPFAEASLHLLIACVLSGENFPVGPSRESNSGLPYSKPTRCQLSHAAPC